MSDMNKEKKAEIIQDALDYLDDDMIESVDALRKRKFGMAENHRESWKRDFRYSRVLAVAASVSLLVIGAYAWENVMGPLGGTQYAPMGTENAPEINDAWVEGKTECESEDAPGLKDEDAVDGTEIVSPGSTDYTSEEVLPSERPEQPAEPVEPIEPDHYAPLGDEYQLMNNYVKVTMLPRKAWNADASLAENFAQSVELEEKYYQKIDAFVEALCTTPLLSTDQVLGEKDVAGDVDVYYLLFQRTDGNIVQVCIWGDFGCAYFVDNHEYCMKIDGEIFYDVLKVLWTKW